MGWVRPGFRFQSGACGGGRGNSCIGTYRGQLADLGLTPDMWLHHLAATTVILLPLQPAVFQGFCIPEFPHSVKITAHGQMVHLIWPYQGLSHLSLEYGPG